ncbi:hypothetical protein [Massilia sp. Root418]|uniref:hypothetical protein n=1 Tax=Massilia sp. Root418 TaxID=1736532 RepID=UPI0012F6C16F|nr:hypothetical protein [Massilia sp. Root418]
MQHEQHKSIFSNVSKFFSDKTPAQKPVTGMRPLTADELRSVAGGPEVEVDNGNGLATIVQRAEVA